MFFYLSRHEWRTDAGPAGEHHSVPYLEVIDHALVIASVRLQSKNDQARRQEAMEVIGQQYGIANPRFLTHDEFHAMFPSINSGKP